MMLNDIPQATAWLDTYLRAADGGAPSLRAAVSLLSQRRQLGILLRSLLDDPQLLAAAAAQSYVHPLGFDKLVLATTPGFQLRLHVWWPGHDGTVEDVHNHRFPFGSSVLDGALEMRTFVRAENGSVMDEYEESGGVVVGRSTLRRVGEAALACTRLTGMAVGTAYSMSARALHRISVTGDRLTATLFLRGTSMGISTSVFSHLARGERRALDRPPMTRSALADRLETYLATPATGSTTLSARP